MVSISAVIITFNEERNIARCLDALVGLADEVVVVDSFSTDRTEAICREKGARFLQRAFDGYAAQKNFALDQAAHDHVLSLDADEMPSDALRQSILAAKRDWQHDGYAMNRLTNYCGQWIRHCGWYPDRKLRLFDRRRARWGGPNPHERLEMSPDSTSGFLPGDLLHFSYYTSAEHLQRARKYAELAARNLRAGGRRVWWWQVAFSPAFKFLRNYVLKMGFLDGRAGFRICRVAALETFWKYSLALRRPAR